MDAYPRSTTHTEAHIRHTNPLLPPKALITKNSAEIGIAGHSGSVESPDMAPDFEDLIEKAFLEGQIDGETMELTYLWLLGNIE